jgi:hypothetical protein
VLPAIDQQRLHEATRYGTEEVQRLMPVENSPELEHAIRQGIGQAVLYYAGSMELSRRLHPSAREKRRA